MADLVVFETAHDVEDRLHFANLGEKFIAEPLALAGAAHQAGDIHHFQHGGHDGGGFSNLGEALQIAVRHRHAAGIGLDRTERIIADLRLGRIAERVKEGRLADIGQADDTASKSHLTALLVLPEWRRPPPPVPALAAWAVVAPARDRRRGS